MTSFLILLAWWGVHETAHSIADKPATPFRLFAFKALTVAWATLPVAFIVSLFI